MKHAHGPVDHNHAINKYSRTMDQSVAKLYVCRLCGSAMAKVWQSYVELSLLCDTLDLLPLQLAMPLPQHCYTV